MDVPLLRDIALITAVAICVVFIFNRLRIPTTVGFLLTGALVGPHGLGLIGAAGQVETLAEIGVIALLFAIGVQFSFRGLMQIKTIALVGGTVQILVTFAVMYLALRAADVNTGLSIFVGMVLVHSSTIVMLRAFQDRAEAESPHARAALGIALLQDIMAIPMMLLTPVLAGVPHAIGISPVALAAKTVLLLVATVAAAKWIVPYILYHINRARDSELFTFAIVSIVLVTAWATSSIGLSLALGAFIAGLIISESEYSQQTLASVLPFRDVFSGFFFVSVGMLLDVGSFSQRPGLVLLLCGGVLLVKGFVAALAVVILRYPLRTAVIAGIGLAQVGEFAFVLAQTGVRFDLLNVSQYQLFLAVSIFTMCVSPFLMRLAPGLAERLMKLPLPAWLKGLTPAHEEKAVGPLLTDHLIIVGFGVNGRHLVKAAVSAGIPHIIIELNPETVHKERAAGLPIFYGDASQPAVLEWAGLKAARVLVVAISDPSATRMVVAAARKASPSVYIIARSRFVRELPDLLKLGANDVVSEEFETSVEIFTRVLSRYAVPQGEIESFIGEVRADGYKMLRSVSTPLTAEYRLAAIPEMELASVTVYHGAEVIGRTLADLDLRRRCGITILAVKRLDSTVANPRSDFAFEEGDAAMVVGRHEDLMKLGEAFGAPVS